MKESRKTHARKSFQNDPAILFPFCYSPPFNAPSNLTRLCLTPFPPKVPLISQALATGLWHPTLSTQLSLLVKDKSTGIFPVSFSSFFYCTGEDIPFLSPKLPFHRMLFDAGEREGENWNEQWVTLCLALTQSSRIYQTLTTSCHA